MRTIAGFLIGAAIAASAWFWSAASSALGDWWETPDDDSDPA
jgi:hypothetical protein